MLSVILSLVAIAIGLCWLYKVTTSNHDYFKNMGLKYIKPLPLIGSNSYLLTSRKPLHEQLNLFYNKFPGEKLFGIFEFGTTAFFIKDINLVKQLTIKDFPHFQDHRTVINPKFDPFLGNSLFNMTGKAWRDMRSTLSPLFTGRKMKIMFQLINNCANEFVDYVHDECKETGSVSYKVKKFFSKYANDVIASCAFGLDCNSLKNTDNEFFEIGNEFQKIMKPFSALKFFLIYLAPRLTKALGITLISHKVISLFNRLIIQTMDMRKKSGIERPDMIQLLMNLKDGKYESLYEKDNKELENERNQINGEIKNTWTDNELMAQSFLFFAAGFETGSTTMQFLFYELAANQDVQQKLYEEVIETNKKLNGEPLSYDVMKSMKYMKMVINETLRRWPPSLATDRQCVKDYSYEDESGLKFSIKEGDIITIPIYSFHVNPEHFPNPDVFDPERFSDENIANVNMDAFLPFGIGPRHCIGFRFALMEIKIILYYFVLHFKFNLGKDTSVPLKLKTFLLGWATAKDVEIEFELRNFKKNV